MLTDDDIKRFALTVPFGFVELKRLVEALRARGLESTLERIAEIAHASHALGLSCLDTDAPRRLMVMQSPDVQARNREHARAIAAERGDVALVGLVGLHDRSDVYLAVVLDFLEVAAGHGLTLENTANAEQFAAMVRGYILRDLPPELAAVLRPHLKR